MSAVRAGWRRQWQILRSTPDYWMTLAVNPLLAVVFLAIVRDAGREDLLGHAVLAPGLLGMWAMALFVSGEVISRDRDFGLLELTVAAPVSYGLVTLGRIGLVTTLSLLAFVESWLVALVLFGIAVPVHHPVAFGAGVAAAAFATAGTALLMSAVFIRSTNARRFQNSLSYPFYVLGGVIVPVALLPGWIEPLTRVVFLSWASDLLRDSLSAGPVGDLWPRVAAVVVLGAAALGLGTTMVERMVARVRRTGEAAFS